MKFLIVIAVLIAGISAGAVPDDDYPIWTKAMNKLYKEVDEYAAKGRAMPTEELKREWIESVLPFIQEKIKELEPLLTLPSAQRGLHVTQTNIDALERAQRMITKVINEFKYDRLSVDMAVDLVARYLIFVKVLIQN